MKYLHYYDTKAAHDAVYNGSDYQEPWVAYIESDEIVTYNKPHDYSNDYLTFKALEDASFSFLIEAVQGTVISYSIDNGKTWVDIASEISTPTVTAGNKILFKALLSGSTQGVGGFSSTGRYEAMGNPYSMLYGDNFKGKLDISDKSSGVATLFYGNTNLISAENLSLPATTLADNCYYDMFNGCTSLTTGPKILPATSLTPNCYRGMFKDCTSLVTAPELPATTLVNRCYQEMFRNCSLLNYIKAMFTTTPSDSYTRNWVSGVASTGIFVKNSAATWNVTGVNGVPTGWTVETASA